jgi:hypothetical protein
MMALYNNLLADSPHQAHFCAKSAHICDIASFLAAAKRAFWPLAGRAGAVSKKERERGGGAAAECEELLREEHVRPSEARGAVAALNLVPTLLLSIDWLAAAAGATTLCCFIAPPRALARMISGLHFCLFLHMHKTILAIGKKGCGQKGSRSVGRSLAPLDLAGRLFIG